MSIATFVDKIFFFIFLTTSLFWWVPVVFFFFLPFFLYRKLKKKIKLFLVKAEKFSDINFQKYLKSRKIVTKINHVEDVSKTMFKNLTNKVYKRSVWWTRFEIIEQIPKRAKVLDIGTGNGYLAELISQVKDADITCIDVVDHNETNLETIIFDGVNLPFNDDQFDIVILSYVLHHVPSTQELLMEAKRVCRGKIVIYEDDAPFFYGAYSQIHQKAYNFISDFDSPVNIRTFDQWKDFFEDGGFEILQDQTDWGFGSLITPIKKAFFVLEPKKNLLAKKSKKR